MPRRRGRQKVPFLSYEGENKSDKFIRLTHSMISNPKFQGLSKTSVVLYIYLKDWACGRIEFEYPESLSSKIMSKATFWNCISELEKEGFIDILKRGRLTKQKNKYRFSDRWVK